LADNVEKRDVNDYNVLLTSAFHKVV